ncbi:hypothetical protein [Arcticibacter eurypsychrophilus]|uniref:hypothetical protein n=1 Tax=Arcticibacter eurypsychrophilus TaxID=1434752 RepID=UPI001B8AAF0E|nr:hypothetical protein [Arcticibacter eurypsychrophilus]
MKHERKMAMVVNQVKMEDEDSLDVLFWLSKSAAERLSEVSRLRRNYFTWADGKFPEKIEKVVHQRKL